MGTKGFVPPKKGGEPCAKSHAVPVVDGKAEEAMNFYVSVFKNSKVGRVTR
jgi:predicted 3-demethylubiquinone-9 3-methyltransferase (glyoxalase superfamily)